MALTQADKAYYKEILNTTSGHRNAERVIPPEYTAFLDQVEQKLSLIHI